MESASHSVVYEYLYHRTRHALGVESDSLSLDVGEGVVLEIEGEEAFGKVVWKGLLKAAPGDLPVPVRVLRRAAEADHRRAAARESRESSALETFQEKINEHDLPMDPLEVDFPDCGTPITFFFYAPERVDFRQLVRSLAAIYRTRIELRQVSPRRRAQWSGGCGSCGRPLCCVTFMHTMPPVPSDAIRAQSMGNSPSKLVGSCGQLKCCLRYELDFYNRESGRPAPQSRTTPCCQHTCPEVGESCEGFAGCAGPISG